MEAHERTRAFLLQRKWKHSFPSAIPSLPALRTLRTLRTLCSSTVPALDSQPVMGRRATRSKRDRANKNRAQPSMLASVAFAVAFALGNNAFESAGEEGAGDGSKVDLRTLGYKRTKVSQRDYWGSKWGTMIRNGTHHDMKTNDGKKFRRR
jgi:hypothetical protein